DPALYPSVADLRRPIEQNADLTAAFTIERSSSSEVPVSFELEYEQSGDAAAYAKAHTAFVRAFTEPILRQSLGRMTEVEAIIVITLNEMPRLLASNPPRYKFRYVAAAVLLRRR